MCIQAIDWTHNQTQITQQSGFRILLPPTNGIDFFFISLGFISLNKKNGGTPNVTNLLSAIHNRQNHNEHLRSI